MQILIYFAIYAGSALMVLNIAKYVKFMKTLHWMVNSPKDKAALYTPLILLVLFLIGYLLVGIIGKPDIVIAGILFGGSIFVFIILNRLFYIVDKVRENEFALAETQNANQAKTVFFSNMSHDIRTPMNAILGYTQLARQEGTTEAEMRDYLGKIDSSGRHLLSLINDVLEMSRIESGRIELENAPTDLREVMKNTRDMFESQMRDKGIDFRVSCEIRDYCVSCDRNRLERVLLNITSNAYKFTPSGGSVDLSLKQTDNRENTGFYELRIKDTGIGMSPEFAEQVFDNFARERTSTVSKIQGTGLGMSITKSIVDMMGGTIRVETEQGAGTEFTINVAFPILEKIETEAGETVCPCCMAPEKRDFTGKKLLLVEDNEINREIAVSILSGAGFELETAENGRAALEKIKASKPEDFDAILMDIQMPEMNGYEATKAIRGLKETDWSSIPVIAMTANAFAEDIELEKEAGMNAHISKPINIEDMMNTLQRFLQ